VDDRVERFRALFDAAYGPLFRYAARRSSEPEDLVAEVLTVAWRRIEEMPEGRELPWLYGTARRVLANQRRSRDRRWRLHQRLALVRPATAADSGDGGLLEAAMSRLSVVDQEVLRLAAWEQLDAAEIGVVLGCTAGAAASRLSRAHARLRTVMTDLETSRTQRGRETADG
jgi:RNA polymerase sigma-70 factor (ECF subfamily)